MTAVDMLVYILSLIRVMCSVSLPYGKKAQLNFALEIRPNVLNLKFMS